MATPVNHLLAAILAASARKADVVPAGFKTSREWAAEWGLCYSRTKALINEGLAAGVVERRVFRIVTGSRGLYPVPHFAEVRRKK